jgi:4-aminobutyrate aminotransferase / (S)-3-amino-2-methylpropionate transaminase / 5-aminovalerate transaminase
MAGTLPSIKTALPGPKSQELMQQREQYVARGISNAHPIFIESAKDALITDVDGNVFIDVASGIGMQNAGHRDTGVVEAVREQLDHYIHPCFHVVPYQPYVELARRLGEKYPADFIVKAMFANSGAEAVENAVKISRRFTAKSGIVTLENSYHGRTLITMAMTSKLKPYGYGFGPFPADLYKTASAYCYRCPLGCSYPSCGIACAEEFRRRLKTVMSPDIIAALIAEPVQGEGGFIVPPPEYLPALAGICKENGILFISDEVQTGFGRTGKLFAIENFGVAPDLMTLSKSIAGGLPLSCVIGRADVMDAPFKGQIGGTFGGAPLSCAAGLAVLDKMEKAKLPQRAGEIGRKMTARLNAMKDKYSCIGEVRGLGAMLGIEFVQDRGTKEPDTKIIESIIKYAFEHGVLLISAGILSNVVRLLPPLVMTDEQVDYVMDTIDAAIGAAQ